MSKRIIGSVMALVAVGLLVSTMTQSPQRTSPHDREVVSKSKLAVKNVPAKDLDHQDGGQVLVDTQWLIQPGVGVGTINRSTTLEQLKQQFGPANVINGPVPGPEGTTLDGVLVFPQDAKKALTIIWKENSSPQKPTQIEILGNSSFWHTVEGITLGTPLKTLETLNGGPFTLSGFDWDYGGTVLSWGDQGRLREKFQTQGHLILRLSVPEHAAADLAEQVSGDQTFRSDHPAMQAINPTVSEIIVML